MKNNKWMPNVLTVSLPTMIVCLALALSGRSAVAEEHDTGFCSNRTLFGDYGMQIEGTFLAPNWPLRTAAMVHFDGRGNMTSKSYVVLNGTPQTQDWRQDDPGTYTVNSDCTVSATFLGSIPAHFVVVNNGKDFRGVVDGDAIEFVGSRVN
jgi:hypothetical protein